MSADIVCLAEKVAVAVSDFVVEGVGVCVAVSVVVVVGVGV